MRTFLIIITLVGNPAPPETVMEVKSIESCLAFKAKVEANEYAEIEYAKELKSGGWDSMSLVFSGHSSGTDPYTVDLPNTAFQVICTSEVK